MRTYICIKLLGPASLINRMVSCFFWPRGAMNQESLRMPAL